MQKYVLSELDSGERVISERIPNVRSVALGFWIGAGSRDETEAKAGASHFIEHLLFKGSHAYTAQQIAEIFDGLGGELNAATSREHTMVYARVPDGHVQTALDVMTDMVFAPTFGDLDSERAVVLEEIAMYEDTPQELVHDLFSEAVFGRHALGRPVIGTADVISSVTKRVLSTYHRQMYAGGNVVIAAAGNIEHNKFLRMLQRAQSQQRPPAGGPRVRRPLVKAPPPGFRFAKKDTEQYHVCLGAPGIARSDRRRFAASILDAILGGSASSRLFQEIREKRGLAYSVYSFASQYTDTGLVGIYVGTREENLATCLEIAGSELADIAAGMYGALGIVLSMELIGMAFGFSLQTVAGLWMLSFDLNVTMEILVLNSAIQGFAVGIVWVPMTMVAFDTLAAKDRAEASSVFHLLRNIGSSFFISLSIAEIVRTTGANYSRLTEMITPYNRALAVPGDVAASSVEVLRTLRSRRRREGSRHRSPKDPRASVARPALARQAAVGAIRRVRRQPRVLVPLRRLPAWRVRMVAVLGVLGPGLVSGFADNDAGGITTYSLAGARFGYSLLWVILASQVVLFFTQEVGARLGLATGKGLMGLIRERWGVRWAAFAAAMMLLANLGSTVAEFAGIGSALSLFGIPPQISAAVAAMLRNGFEPEFSWR